jgi:hypothetical protein
MALTALNHKMIDVEPVGVAGQEGNLDALYDALTASTYYDGTARTPGSGSAVKNVTKVEVATVTEAIYGEFAGANMAGWKWMVAGASGKSPGKIAGPDTGSGVFWLTIVRNAGAYADWQHASAPFTTGDFPGFWAILENVHATALSRVWCIESQDSLWMAWHNAGSPGYSWLSAAGAMWDPDSTDPADSESNGRRVGMLVSSQWGLTGDMHQSAGSILGYTASGQRPHTGVIDVGADTMTPLVRTTLWTGDPGGLIYPSGKSARLGHLAYKSYSTGSFVGQLRDVDVIGNSKTGLVAENAGADVGYVVGQYADTSADAILLRA